MKAIQDDISDFAAIKTKILKPLLPILGFYAVMLAPIYGKGYLSPLGSMTDFNTVQNRGTGTSIANEYFSTPDGYMKRARAQVESPIYNVNADRLDDVMCNSILNLERSEMIDDDADTRLVVVLLLVLVR